MLFRGREVFFLVIFVEEMEREEWGIFFFFRLGYVLNFIGFFYKVRGEDMLIGWRELR